MQDRLSRAYTIYRYNDSPFSLPSVLSGNGDLSQKVAAGGQGNEVHTRLDRETPNYGLSIKSADAERKRNQNSIRALWNMSIHLIIFI